MSKSVPTQVAWLVILVAVAIFAKVLWLASAHMNAMDTAFFTETPFSIITAKQMSPQVENQEANQTKMVPKEQDGAILYQDELQYIREEAMIQDENGNSRYEYFPEIRTISGTYEKLVSGIVEMGVTTNVIFIPDDSERKKLPPHTNRVYNIQFFNRMQAENLLGTYAYAYSDSEQKSCVITGRATIEISDYAIDNLPSEVMYDSAVLKRVVKKEASKKSCF